MQEIRQRIDVIDSEIIGLLAKRAGLVAAAGALKKNEESVRDTARVEQVMNKVRAKNGIRLDIDVLYTIGMKPTGK